MSGPENYRRVVKRLRDERGMTVEDVVYAAWQKGADRAGASISVIQKRLAPANRSAPSVAILEAIAAGLDVDPDVFHEYRLAKARELFDETALGLEEALANLSAFEQAVRAAQRQAADAA